MALCTQWGVNWLGILTLIGQMTAPTATQYQGMPSFILGERSPGCPSNNPLLPSPPPMQSISPLWRLWRSLSGSVVFSPSSKKRSQDWQFCTSITPLLTSLLGTLSTMPWWNTLMSDTTISENVLPTGHSNSSSSVWMTWQLTFLLSQLSTWNMNISVSCSGWKWWTRLMCGSRTVGECWGISLEWQACT